MAEKVYLIHLGGRARKRHYHKTDQGQVVAFMVQLSYAESLDLADKDINGNWDIYQERFLRGDFP